MSIIGRGRLARRYGFERIYQKKRRDAARGVRGSVMALPNPNHFLASLSDHDRSLLEPHLNFVPLATRQALQVANQEVRDIYFPRSGIMSIVVAFADGRTAEAALLGSNTVVGLAALFGDSRALNLVSVQISGGADKMERRRLEACAHRSRSLMLSLRRHEQALCAQMSQIAACNAVHSAQERLCRWLLQCRDLLGTNELPLTQEFLAALLGVRRASVTLIAGELESSGLVASRRGHVQLRQLPGLQDASCECYDAIKEQVSRLIGWTPKSGEVGTPPPPAAPAPGRGRLR